MPPAYFLCYRREDAGWAAALYGALVKVHGPSRVFKDITSLPLAADWRGAVAAGLDRSSHVVALVGPRWMDGVDAQGRSGGRSDPIVFELTEARARGLAIVPVLVGGAQMPPAARLPAQVRPITELNAAHIRPESADADIVFLVSRLPQPRVARLPQPGVAPRPVPPEPTETRPRWRTGLAVGVAVAVVVAVVVGVVALVSKIDFAGAGPPPVLTIQPTKGRVGTRINATATGFDPGATVQFLFQARPLAESVADANGTVSATFTVPQSPSGTLTVTATQQRSVKYDDALFTVT